MQTLPRSLPSAFEATAAELGWCTTSRLFARELAEAGGESLVRLAAAELGREYPIFGCIVAPERDLADVHAAIDPEPVVAALAGSTRVVLIGLETDFLDALVPRLAGMELGLVTVRAGLEPDWRRVLANYDGQVSALGLADVQRWAGRRSALLTFVYGADDHVAHVAPSWLRVSGPDVRSQFRAHVGWDVLGQPMTLYPRWLVPTHVSDFSHLVRGRESQGQA